MADDLAYLKLLIAGVSAAVAFEDWELKVLLDTLGDPRLAAADVYEMVADNEVLVGKVIRTLDLSTDGVKVGDYLLKRAARLREAVEKELDAYAVEIAGFEPYQFGDEPELAQRSLF